MIRFSFGRSLGIALACASIGSVLRAQDNGKLLIIGGGMTSAMAPIVYGALADQMPPHGVVGIFPTAGEGAPNDATTRPTSQPSTQPVKDRFLSNLKGHTGTLINITQHDAAKADDPALAKQIEACDALFFNGGAQSRVINVFHPDGRETAISKAVDDVLARGGLVSGTGAAAEIMSDPMIMMGESADALAGKKPVPIGRGMGYFKFGLVDQHFLQRGRFGRLVVALEQIHQNFGYGISEARAILVDRATGTITTIGPDACVFIDRREASGRTNLRVSLLGNGDAIDGKSGTITIASEHAAMKEKSRTGSVPDVNDPWAKLAVGKLVHDLVASDKATGSLIDKSATLTFTVDSRTKLYASDKNPGDISVTELRLDVSQAK